MKKHKTSVDRSEFAASDELNCRNQWEHPESAYRRGFVHGTYFLSKALADYLDAKTRERIADYFF
jgi:hypothetical protein